MGIRVRCFSKQADYGRNMRGGSVSREVRLLCEREDRFYVEFISEKINMFLDQVEVYILAGPTDNFEASRTAMETFMQIGQMIITDLITKKNKYDHIIGLFAKSQCEHTEAIKELLTEEQNTVVKITDMFKEMTRMLMEAFQKVEQVEEHYSDEHVTMN